MKNRDYSPLYKILEVEPGSSLEEITRSYRGLIDRYHPDKVGHSQENLERFHQILEAYTALRVRIRARGEIKRDEFIPEKSNGKDSGENGRASGTALINRLSSVFGKVFSRESDKDFIFEKYVENLGTLYGLDLFAVCSIKGGIGKSMISNSLAMTLALTLNYISQVLKKRIQKVELIDLDFGKPDQRFLTGVEPKYFIENIFGNAEEKIDWDMLKTPTPISNLKIISSSLQKHPGFVL